MSCGDEHKYQDKIPTFVAMDTMAGDCGGNLLQQVEILPRYYCKVQLWATCSIFPATSLPWLAGFPGVS